MYSLTIWYCALASTGRSRELSTTARRMAGIGNVGEGKSARLPWSCVETRVSCLFEVLLGRKNDEKPKRKSRCNEWAHDSDVGRIQGLTGPGPYSLIGTV